MGGSSLEELEQIQEKGGSLKRSKEREEIYKKLIIFY